MDGKSGELLFWVVGPAAKVGVFKYSNFIRTSNFSFIFFCSLDLIVFALQVVDSLSDEEVAQGATTLLQKIHRNKNIPNARSNSLTHLKMSLLWLCLSRVTRHPWTNDPFTLGAYSYPRYGAKEGVQVRAKIVNTL